MSLRRLLTVLLLSLAAPVIAEEDPRWSMSVMLGGHLPQMEDLSKGLYRAPMMGNATVLVYEGQSTDAGIDIIDEEDVDENITELQNFQFDNPVPAVGVGANVGIEFMWHANERHSLAIGMGSWEKVSVARTFGTLPLQQYYTSNIVFSERRDKISYTEYTLGWRYNLIREPRFKLYSRLNLHEVFDIDFREDFTFRFVSSPIEGLEGVRRVMVVEAQTAALLMGQLALGGEWFLSDWFSLGFEGGYMLGERDFRLRDVKIKDDFLDTEVLNSDSINRRGLPYTELADGTLGYLTPGATLAGVNDPEVRDSLYEQVVLGFDGWRFMFKVNFYY